MIKIIKNVVLVAGISALSQAAVAGTYQECISTANEINQTSPQQIDKVTLLLNATCKEEGKKVILSYSYMLETENPITKEAIESMRPNRRLPRQVDKLKVEISALITLGRYASGVFLPRDS